jgi:hypothetical protein
LSLNGRQTAAWGIWLDYATVAKLKVIRGPGDSFSDVILALAKDERV